MTGIPRLASFAIPLWVKLLPVGIMAIGLGIQSYRISLWKADYASLEAASAQRERDIIQASNDATRAAYEAADAKERENEAIREKSAKTYADLSARYRASVLRLPSSAYTDSTGKTDLPGNADATGRTDDQAGDTIVSISRADALICGENTAKLMAAYEWAQGIK